jgi:hypothetical protein
MWMDGLGQEFALVVAQPPPASSLQKRQTLLDACLGRSAELSSHLSLPFFIAERWVRQLEVDGFLRVEGVDRHALVFAETPKAPDYTA